MNVTNRLSLQLALVISASIAVVCLALHQCLPGLCLRFDRTRVEKDFDHTVAAFSEAQRQVQALAEQVASSDDIKNVFTRHSPTTLLHVRPSAGLKAHDGTHVILLSPSRDVLVGGRIGERMTSVERLNPELLQALRSHKGIIRSSPVPRLGTTTASRTAHETLIAVVPVTAPEVPQTLGHVVLLRFIDDSLLKKIAFQAQANFSVMPVGEAMEQDPVIRANFSKIAFNKKPVVTETEDFVKAYGSIKDSQGTTNILLSAVRRRELSDAAAGLRPYLLIVAGIGFGVAGMITFCLTRLRTVDWRAKLCGNVLPDDSLQCSTRASAEALLHLTGLQGNSLSACIIPSDDRIDDLENAIAYWWHDIAASSALTSMWLAEDVLDIRDVYQRMGRSYRRLLIVLEAFHDCFTEQSDLVIDAYHAKDREQLLFAVGASKGYLLDISARKAVALCGRIEALAHTDNVAEAEALVLSLAEQMRMLFCLISRILSSSATIVSPQEADRTIAKASIS